MLKYYDFSGASFLVDKRFECENASENAAERFVQPGWLIVVQKYCTVQYLAAFIYFNTVLVIDTRYQSVTKNTRYRYQ